MQVNKRLTSVPISWQSKKTLPRETVIIIIIILAFTLYTIVQKIPSCRERRKEEKRIGIDRIGAIATRSCVSFPRESLKFRKQGKGERDFVIDISRRNKALDSLESLHRARDRRRSDSAFPQLVRGMERGTDRKRNENVATQRTPSPSPGRPALERRKILKRLFLRGDWK